MDELVSMSSWSEKLLNKHEDTTQPGDSPPLPEEDEENEDPYEWMSLMGDGVKLRIVAPLDSGSRVSLAHPEVGDWVTISFKCRELAAPTDGGGDNPGPLLFSEEGSTHILGDAEVPPGLELGLRFMRKSERGELQVKSRFAYGDRSIPEINVDGQDLMYEVVLSDIKCSADFTAEDKLSIAKRKKELGNKEFKRGEMKAAMKLYDASCKLAVDEVNSGKLEARGEIEIEVRAVSDKRSESLLYIDVQYTHPFQPYHLSMSLTYAYAPLLSLFHSQALATTTSRASCTKRESCPRPKKRHAPPSKTPHVT